MLVYSHTHTRFFCHREKLNEPINVIADSKIEEKTKQKGNPFVFGKLTFLKSIKFEGD